jgi:hypothetical protein
MEGFYGQMEALLLQIGYLYPHTCAQPHGKVAAFFQSVCTHRTGISYAEGAFAADELGLRRRSPVTASISAFSGRA